LLSGHPAVFIDRGNRGRKLFSNRDRPPGGPIPTGTGTRLPSTTKGGAYDGVMDIVLGVAVAVIVLLAGFGGRAYLRSRPAARENARRWLPVLWAAGGVLMLVVAVLGMVSHGTWVLPLVIGLGLIGCAVWADADNRGRPTPPPHPRA
jgi:hypothetical protein